jgi:hypothetical protein
VHRERGRQQEKEEEKVRRLSRECRRGLYRWSGRHEAAGDGRKSGENTGAIPKTDALGCKGQWDFGMGQAVESGRRTVQ